MAEMKTANGSPIERQVKLAKIAHKCGKYPLGKLRQAIRHPLIYNELRQNGLLKVKLSGEPLLDALILDSARSDNAHISRNVRIITDEKLNIMHASAGVEQLLGCDPEGMRWGSVEDMVKPEAKLGFSRFVEILKYDRRLNLSAMPVIGCAGNTVWVNGNAIVVRNPGGSAVGYSFSIYDASKDVVDKHGIRLAAEKAKREVIRLEGLLKDQGKFLSISYHDLRNHMNGVMGFLELLGDYLPKGDADAIQMQEAARSAAESAYNFLTEIVTHAKLQVGSTGLQKERFCADEAVEKAAGSMGFALKLTGRKLTYVKCGMDVYANMATTTSAIRNMLANALKYGTEVHLGTYVEGNSLVIRVSDNGPGNEGLEALFEEIGKKGAVEGSKGGIGIGLALCYDFALANGGTMRAQNRLNPDGSVAGADFFLSVPLAKD